MSRSKLIVGGWASSESLGVHPEGSRFSEPRRNCRPDGFNLLESLLVLALIIALSVAAIPPIHRWSRGLRVSLAADELVGVLRLARSAAIRHSTKVGVKFRPGPGDQTTFRMYRDGDGDGVLTRDIDAGIDPPLSLPQELAHIGRQIRFGFPVGVAPRDPGDPRRRLARLDDPIRFNRSDIASFNHLGSSTPGSLYITDGQHHLSAVRLFGRTGKVKVIRYDIQKETWE